MDNLGPVIVMTSEPAQRLRSRAGYSLIELLTAVAIFGILAAAGLPHVDTRRQDIRNASEQVIADYRWARTRAITSGAHFNVSWTSESTYEVQRMKQDPTGAWILDTVVKQVSLPSGIERSGWPNDVEFNTRGMMISQSYAMFDLLWDTQFSTYRMFAVWPSGQTNEYY